MRLSLRVRLNLILFMTIALVMLCGTLLVVFNARQSVRDEITSTLNLAVQLIRLEFAEGRSIESSPVKWFENFKSLGPSRHLKIDLRQNRENPPHRVDPKAGNLVVASSVPNWFIWAVAPEAMLFSQVIKAPDGQDWRFSIEADPSDEIVEAWNEAVDFFGLIVGMVSLVLVLVTISVDRAFRPVAVILDGLDRLENGEYQKRLPDFPLPEFNRIARAMNQTAAALESSRRDNLSLRQHSLEVREQERQHLARELHDEFGQSLSAIKAIAVSLKKRALEPAASLAVDSIRATCDHLFDVLANLLQRLNPLMLEELGLKATLEELLENGLGRKPFGNLTFHCDSEVDEFRAGDRIHVFRIVQESLTNILKHADAKNVSVCITVLHKDCDRKLHIAIADDGIGFDPNAIQRGFGLRGIRERVEGLAGALSIGSEPGRGVAIAIDLPFAPRTS